MLRFSNQFCWLGKLMPEVFELKQSSTKHCTNIIVHIILYTAGVAVLLTIITYFSTPILTKIFGDGSLEVGKT